MTDLPGLHVVTHDAILTRPDFVTLAGEMDDPSIALHLRGRDVPGKTLQGLVTQIRNISTALRIFVNDRVDVALSTRADGVHLPELGLPPDRVRHEFGRSLIIGKSTHSVDDARRAAMTGADYVFLGPVWPTRSHPDRQPIGIDAILETAADVRVVAIGGINPQRARQCLHAGAYGVAVISSVWDHPRPSSVALELVSILKDR